MLKIVVYLLLVAFSATLFAGCSTVGNSSIGDVVPMRAENPNKAVSIPNDEAAKTPEQTPVKTVIDGPKVGDKSNANLGNKDNKNRGSNFKESDPTIVALMQENAPKFVQETYYDSQTGITLAYSLFVPKDYDQNKAYPMLMYIPDASAGGKSAKDIVEQYFGADIWVTDEEQAKHPSFVLVPAFSEVVVDDSFTTSKQIDAAVNLLQYLTQKYNIDTNRLYTTGQSMGCMTSLYLNSKYPDLFAASLFVSGQWDISVLQPLLKQKFFYITAAGDEKASGGQDEVMNMFKANKVPYSYATWSAKDDEILQNLAVRKMLKAGNNANFIRFERGSVLDGSSNIEHMASFKYGYKLTSVRDWLYAQHK